MPDDAEDRSENIKTYNSFEANKNYNFLTGASMTNTNANKLKQITQNLMLNNDGVKTLILERPSRQLLVNESVLKKNQMYKQQ